MAKIRSARIMDNLKDIIGGQRERIEELQEREAELELALMEAGWAINEALTNEAFPEEALQQVLHSIIEKINWENWNNIQPSFVRGA